MVLICGDHNENARFTRGTWSTIYFPGRGNNSLWACLCSDFNLWAPRSCWRTLMFCLNELTVLLDTALQSTESPPPPPPPRILSPVINTVRAQRYQILDHMPTKPIVVSLFPFNFVNDWNKYDCGFPLNSIRGESPLKCGAVCEQTTLGWFLLPYSSTTSTRWAFMSDAPSGHGVWLSLGKDNNLQHTSIIAPPPPPSFRIRARKLWTQACYFTDEI